MTQIILIKISNGVVIKNFSLIEKADTLLDIALLNTSNEDRLKTDFPLDCLKLGNTFRQCFMMEMNKKHLDLNNNDLGDIQKIKNISVKYLNLKNIININYVKDYKLEKINGFECKVIDNEDNDDNFINEYKECPIDYNIDDFYIECCAKYSIKRKFK